MYRNIVPSRDYFSIIERTTEITYFFALTLIFVLRANLKGSQASNNIRAIIELAILLIVLIKLKLNVIFWEKRMNELLVYGVCVLIGCSSSYILVQTAGDYIKDSQRTLVCIICSLIVKIALNLRFTGYHYLDDWNISKNSLYNDSVRIFALYRHRTLDTLWFDNLINEKETAEKEEYMFYEGQIKAHKEKCYIITCPCQLFEAQQHTDCNDLMENDNNEILNKINGKTQNQLAKTNNQSNKPVFKIKQAPNPHDLKNESCQFEGKKR